jgi:hypothetical protein
MHNKSLAAPTAACVMLSSALLLVLAIAVAAVVASAQEEQSFKLISVNVKPQTGMNVYPGSKGVEVDVDYTYNGGNPARVSAACLKLPEGITPSRGYTGCSPAYTANGTVYTSIDPGSYVRFRYVLDIDKNVTPGSYRVEMVITYYIESNGALEGPYEESYTFYINVSRYPPVKLRVLSAYLSPYGYPGSSSQLNIVLYNNGTSTVTGGTLQLSLPPGFTASTSSIQLPAIPLGSAYQASVTVSINPSVAPGTYLASLEGTVAALTPDNVAYTSRVRLEFSFNVNSPPQNIVATIDKGFTAAPAGQAAGTKAYVVLQVVQPTATVYNVLARWHIVGGRFANGSTTAISTVSGVYNYGDVIVVESPLLTIDSSEVEVHVTLEILASVGGGSPFWVKLGESIRSSLPPISPKLQLVNVYWREGEAYPGSSNLHLSVVLENQELAEIESLTAVLQLPPGVFAPANLTARLSQPIGAYRQFELSFGGIYVNASVKPGAYIAKLHLKGSLRLLDGSHLNFTETLAFEVQVHSRLGKPLQLVAIAPRGYRLVEGMVGGSITLSFVVSKPVTLNNLYVEIKTVGPVSFLGKPYTIVRGSYTYGDIVQATIGDLVVAPGSRGRNATLIVVMRGLASFGGSEYWFEQVEYRNITIEPAAANLTLIEASFEPLLASGEYAAGGRLSLSFLSLNKYEVDRLIVEICLSNAIYLDGSKCRVVSVDSRLAYGDVIVVSSDAIEASNTSTLKAQVHVTAKVVAGGATYLAVESFNVTVKLRAGYHPLRLCCTETLYNSQPAPILPGQRGVQLSLTLVNHAPYPIASVAPQVHAPPGFNVTRIGGTCFAGVTPGSTCTITLTLDTLPSLQPGLYRLNLTLETLLSTANSVTVFTENLTLPLLVQPVDRYTPNLTILWAGWGTGGGIVYSGSGLATLQVQIYNPSRWPAEGVTGKLSPVNSSVRVVSDSSYCSQLLNPGSSCTLLFTVNLEDTPSGLTIYRLHVGYLVRVYGVNRIVERSYTLKIPVYKYTGMQGIQLIDYGWLNSWHVYQNTTNATYTVTLANLNPYPIGGIYAELILPKGFRSASGEANPKTYLSGPIQPLGRFTISFSISVADVKPGQYRAELLVRYLPQVRGATEFKQARFTVYLEVSSLREDIELLSVRWLSMVPQPDTKGAILELSFRNDNVAIMRAPAVHIITPPNVTCSVNNATEATLPILTQLPPKAGISMGASGSELVQQLSRLLGGAGTSYSVQTIRSGSIFRVLIPLNLHLRRPEMFNITVGLDFIDHWGSKRRVYYSVQVPPYGSAELLKVSAPSTVSFYNGVGRTYVEIRNVGSGPLYNVYVYILPQSPLATISDNVFYISTLRPQESVRLNFTLYYNPLSTRYFGGSIGEYSSIPLMVAVLFRDYSGFEGHVNLTVSLKAKPLIDLRFGPDLKVERKGRIIYAGGTVENHGISKAYSVAVYLRAGNSTGSTFLGDIDAGGQTAFRVEAGAPPGVRNVTLLLVYRDAYGGEHAVRVVRPVVTVVENVTATSAASESHGLLRGYAVGVVAGVAVFLAVAAYLIYRLIKRHEHRLERV